MSILSYVRDTSALIGFLCCAAPAWKHFPACYCNMPFAHLPPLQHHGGAHVGSPQAPHPDFQTTISHGLRQLLAQMHLHLQEREQPDSRKKGLKGRLRLDKMAPEALKKSAGGQALTKMGRGMKSLARPSEHAHQVGFAI